MTENPEPELLEGSVAEPATESVAARIARRARGGRIAAVTWSVLLVCALVGGIGSTVKSVRDADRSPGKPAWKFPAADKAGQKDGRGAKEGLSALLLPFDETARAPGPDVGDFGNDVELNGEKATVLRKEALEGLPGPARRQLTELIDKQGIEGMALRSYAVLTKGAHLNPFTAEVTLQRMKNRGAVRDMAASVQRLLTDTGLFREGPKIKGHKNARCFVTRKDKEGGLEGAICSAHVGDVLVNVGVNGPGPLDRESVSAFLTAQLDRIDDLGLAV
ncbi:MULTISPECIES: hypothetical protein [unclassified Streptomyces]|uniref:hypothetical protein n=1 Tax=unclassified Streptomyces TaxID=2593676 RepID=UPI000F6B527D|nr:MULTISPECIES: hypothetical protein [unclassified Streptomyces]AZM61474.1 hypothetical protein DLM49_19780 [Streptomyces sp. WAC 01438]RSM98361.1 hypothetical protein DMA10_09390 [Streptomyces sp. WAC 01420]